MNKLTPLAEIADELYSTMDLGQDGDEDYPESYWHSEEGVKKVILRAFGSSDCGNFSVVLHEITGYPIYNLIGPDACPVHSFVMTPSGYALDVYGLSDVRDVAKRYGFKGVDPRIVMVDPEWACGVTLDNDVDVDGQCPERSLIVQLINQIPWHPFSHPGFKDGACDEIEVPRETSCVYGAPVVELIDKWIKSTRGYGQDLFEDLMVLPAIQLALLKHGCQVKLSERMIKVSPSVFSQVHAFEIDGRTIGLAGEGSWDEQAKGLWSTWVGETRPPTQSSISIPEGCLSVEDLLNAKINRGAFSSNDIAVIERFLVPVEDELLGLQMEATTPQAPSPSRKILRL